MRKGNPKIVTVGDARARRETPREWWGAADWGAEARARWEHTRPLDQVPITQPQLPTPTWSLHPANPDGTRSKAVDMILDRLR